MLFTFVTVNATATYRTSNDNFVIDMQRFVHDLCYRYLNHLNPDACTTRYMSCINFHLFNKMLDNLTWAERKEKAFRECLLKPLIPQEEEL